MANLTPERMLENRLIDATLLVWMAVHGHLCLALRHPENEGAAREMVEKFLGRLGETLVASGVFTRAEFDAAMQFEQEAQKAQKAQSKSNAAPLVLQIDPSRVGKLPTGICIRARDVMGAWINCDISELTNASLQTWLRSRGGSNELAERLVWMLLHEVFTGAGG